MLVVGAGRGAVPTLEALRRLGCELIVLDGVAGAPGFRLADAVVLASAFDPEAVVEAARTCAARTRIDAVLATGRRASLAAAAAREALGLPGVRAAAARRLASRLTVKSRLRAAGIPVPWCSAACAPAVVRQIVAVASTPLVVKPVDGWEACGIVRLLDGIDLAWAHRVACFASPSSQVMIEAWHEGRRLSMLALASGGGCTVVDVVERARDAHDRFAPFLVDAGHERPDDLPAADEARAAALVAAVATALELRGGVLTCELVLGPQGPIVVDVTTDVIDGVRCAVEVPLAAGIDLVAAALGMGLGTAPAPATLRPRWRRAVARRAVFAAAGAVVGVEDGSGEGTAAYLLVEPGTHVPPPTSNLCHAGVVVAAGRDREEAAARAAAAAGRIRVETRADERDAAAQR